MNTRQACIRLRSILGARRWGGTSAGDKLLGTVLCTPGAASDVTDQLRLPAAFIAPGSGSVDPTRPELVNQDITVVVITSLPGDMFGQRALIGGTRPSATSAKSRGVLEIEEEVLAAIAQLDASQQFRIGLKWASAVGAEIDEQTGYHQWRRYTFRALLTVESQHDAPRAGNASESGGTVTISWTAPDDTTNLVSYVVRRVSGTVPVAFPDEGTEVSWSSGTSTTDSPGSGTWSYSIFATYDDEGGSWAGDVSDMTTAEVTIT